MSNCLQKCSGLQITSFEKTSIVKNKELITKLDSFHSLLMENLKEFNEYALSDQLTSMSKDERLYFLITFLIFQSFQKNSELQGLIEKLSEKYWNYKGFYKSKYKGYSES